MKPSRFAYHRPGTLAEALDAMASLDDARPLAGGQSLMPMMNFRFVTPAHLVDLNRIDALAGIEDGDAALEIGAMTRQQTLLRSEVIARRCPLLGAALAHVGHVQTRNRGTIGGSLVHLDPSAELPAVLAATDAVLLVASARGTREVAMRDWCLGYMTPNLEPDELLVSVHIPHWPAGHGFAFEEMARRHGDFALAAAAVLVVLDERARLARVAIALAGIGDAPLRLAAAETTITGDEPTAGAIAAAAAHAREVPATSDVHASDAYRRRVGEVLVRRALERAVARAR
ncbi:MAG: FAD binding domain-containing protein [Gammaproteobacteria bacterium]|nr:FAD binding domain-containing protein [Gammaproteobacteria bacterium]